MNFVFNRMLCSMLFSISQFAQHLKICLLSLPLTVALGARAASQSAKVIRAGSPQPATILGVDLAHCIRRPGRLRICKTASAVDAHDRGSLIIEKAGKRMASWPIWLFAGQTSDFEVLQADLDGNGRSELILANHDSSSMGIGLDFWTIYIFPDSEFRGPQAPLIFGVDEYGALGTFVPEGDHVLILTTKWLGMEDPQGKRDEGLYLVGQWWRYKSGELLPVVERPLMARRFLFSFAIERDRTESNPRRPYLWLRSRKTELLKESPLIGDGKKEEKRGVLQSVDVTPLTHEEATTEIVFKPQSGQPVTLRYPADNSLKHLGDAVSGRIYPDRYLPAMREKLRGRQARLVTYGDDSEVEGEKVLWLTRSRD